MLKYSFLRCYISEIEIGRALREIIPCASERKHTSSSTSVEVKPRVRLNNLPVAEIKARFPPGKPQDEQHAIPYSEDIWTIQRDI